MHTSYIKSCGKDWQGHSSSKHTCGEFVNY